MQQKASYFNLGKQILRHLLEEPIKNHASLDASLAVQYQDHLAVLRIVQLLLDSGVAQTHVVCCVAKSALHKTLYDIKNDSITVGQVPQDVPRQDQYTEQTESKIESKGGGGTNLEALYVLLWIPRIGLLKVSASRSRLF